MKNILLILFALIAAACGKNGAEKNTYKYPDSPTNTVLIKNGEGQKSKGSSNYFTGDVEVQAVTSPNETSKFSVAYVTFQGEQEAHGILILADSI